MADVTMNSATIPNITPEAADLLLAWDNSASANGEFAISALITLLDARYGQRSSGSFTPVLQFGGATTGITYGSGVVGRWERVGNIVTIDVRFNLTSKGSATGVATIAGLPFACVNAADNPVWLLNAIVNNPDASFNKDPSFFVLANQSVISLAMKNAADAGVTNVVETHLANTSQFRITGWYECAP